MSIGIYKITNQINNKCYIGQSIQIEKRWYQHKWLAKQNIYPEKALYLAFNKYGIENFTFEIIEICEKEKLNEREQYWINYYDSYNNGYNTILVNTTINYDDLNQHSKIPVLCYDLEGKFIKEYSSISEASRETNVHQYTIGQCIRGESLRGGNYQWKKKENNNYPLQISKYIKKKNKGKKVIQYDKNNNIINIFDTILEASQKTGISRRSINRSCDGESEFVKGYKWVRIEEEK